MRTVLLCLLLAGPALARPEAPFVADEWRLEGTTLHLVRLDDPKSGWIALSINVADLARRLEIKEDAVPDYLKSLDPKLPILVQLGYKTGFAGIWSLNEERLRKHLRLDLSPDLKVQLVCTGSWPIRVVMPNDGSESGWREPEIYFEREVEGKWVRGSKPGRCGMYAQEWQKDIVSLTPGKAVPIDGYHSLEMAFGLARPYKAKVRAVYVYSGGHGSKNVVTKLEPGLMGKTPPFTLFSEPVEVEFK